MTFMSKRLSELRLLSIYTILFTKLYAKTTGLASIHTRLSVDIKFCKINVNCFYSSQPVV